MRNFRDKLPSSGEVHLELGVRVDQKNNSSPSYIIYLYLYIFQPIVHFHLYITLCVHTLSGVCIWMIYSHPQIHNILMFSRIVNCNNYMNTYYLLYYVCIFFFCVSQQCSSSRQNETAIAQGLLSNELNASPTL